MNDDPRAAQAFILINEAYEFLSDSDRRDPEPHILTGRQKEEARRRARWTEWEQYQKEEVRRRAAAHAQESFDKFSQSRIYRAAMVLDRVYKYVFIGAGLLMALGPLVMRSIADPIPDEEVSIFSIIMPFLIGAAFLYGIWYFLFNLEE